MSATPAGRACRSGPANARTAGPGTPSPRSRTVPPGEPRRGGYAGAAGAAQIQTLSAVAPEAVTRIGTGVGGAGPGPGRRPGPGLRGPAGRRPRDRQVHPAASGLRRPGGRGPGPLCHRGGVPAAGQPARQAPGSDGAGHPPPGGDLRGARPRRGGGRVPAGHGGGLDPDPVHRTPALGPGVRLPGARDRRPVGALRQAGGHRRSSWSGMSPRKGPSPAPGSWSTWWTPSSTSRARPADPSAWCGPSRTASARSTSWASSP